MKIDYICELDNLDIIITKQGNLKFKLPGNKQYKKAHIGFCERCGSLFISSRENTVYCSNGCWLLNDLDEKENKDKEKRERKERLQNSNIFCELCGKKQYDLYGLSHHLVQLHNYRKGDLERYYNNHLRSENDGNCIICGNKTKFGNLVNGYKKLCNNKECHNRNNRNVWKEKKKDEEWLEGFRNRISRKQLEIWRKRIENGEYEEMVNRVSIGMKRTISQMSEQERKEKFGWMNKIPQEEREFYIGKVTKPLFDYMENETEEQRKNRKEKAKKSKLGNRYYTDIYEEYCEYYRIVVTLTEQNYKKYKNIINPDNLPRGNNDYHLDHKFSIVRGFEEGISPEIIASPENLEMLFCRENISKKDTCSITKEDLYELTTEKLQSEKT